MKQISAFPTWAFFFSISWNSIHAVLTALPGPPLSLTAGLSGPCTSVSAGAAAVVGLAVLALPNAQAPIAIATMTTRRAAVLIGSSFLFGRESQDGIPH